MAGESGDKQTRRLHPAVEVIILYVVFCIVGAGLEWCYGTFWDVVGVAPWVYPDSWLRHTSLEGVPLWGLGGMICVSIYKAAARRNAKWLLGMLISLVLAVLWIFIYSKVIQ